MKLLVPATFQDDLLEAMRDLQVGSLYGSLPSDPSLRAKRWLPQVGPEQFEAYVQRARDLGIAFIYTLNTRSQGSWEFTAQGQRWLAERLGWLSEIGVEGVVTANPYIMELVKRRFPELQVHVSTLADVDDVDKARFFEDLGADAIYLPEYTNRHFRFLRKVALRVRCRLVVTLNLGCVPRCPIRGYHTSCISQSAHSLDDGHFVDYSMMKCTLLKLLDPAQLIKGPWVRPEDLGLYEELGIHEFKVAGREQGAEWILRAVRAYAFRRYDGYLNDLVTGFDSIEPFGSLPLRIDNRALDGLLSFISRRDCSLGCLDCSYCEQRAAEAVAVDREQHERYTRLVERMLNRFTSGSFRAPVTLEEG